MLESEVVKCGSVDLRTNTNMKEYWTMYSKHANHPWYSSQHDWVDTYDQLMSTRIFTFLMNKIFI